ncbi:DUF2771 domain-containing protein [Mycolicibacterium thermoresistibile]
MKRGWALLAVVAVLAAVGTGLLVSRLSEHRDPQLPEISVYSAGQLIRVGPFQYCPVLDLDNCATTGAQGELPVNDRDVVQLSVPSAISGGPWRLLRVYEDPIDTTVSHFRPDSRLAETIETVDPHRGRLTGIAVQLMTLVQDENGELFDLPHAEWSVATVWPD